MPVDRYWRSSPWVFSLGSRCHGLYGSAKNTQSRAAARRVRTRPSLCHDHRLAFSAAGRHTHALPGDSLSGTHRIDSLKLCQKDQARCPLHEAADGRAILCPLNEAASPVGRYCPCGTSAGYSVIGVILGIGRPRPDVPPQPGVHQFARPPWLTDPGRRQRVCHAGTIRSALRGLAGVLAAHRAGRPSQHRRHRPQQIAWVSPRLRVSRSSPLMCM